MRELIVNESVSTSSLTSCIDLYSYKLAYFQPMVFIGSLQTASTLNRTQTP